MIFVFGSNLAGIHGAGAALYAMKHKGARYRIGEGLMSNSYALPTKDHQIQTLPIEQVKKYVDRFLEFAKQRQDLEFQVTRIGCGLAGYTDAEIAPLFIHHTDNCQFDSIWAEYLPSGYFWGSV